MRRRIDSPCNDDGPADLDKPHLGPLSHLLPHYRKHVVSEGSMRASRGESSFLIWIGRPRTRIRTLPITSLG
jgi:hypothetical protein